VGTFTQALYNDAKKKWLDDSLRNWTGNEVMNKKSIVRVAVFAAFALTTTWSFAQQINWTPGSPDATTSISGNNFRLPTQSLAV